ncbi:class I SAM-dependent methyltransferase [Candidatus Pacearchaeota archaeon]|nr:class I SAM-dependent methyltransferase [Candidatus Pacearchaeota archaeon]
MRIYLCDEKVKQNNIMAYNKYPNQFNIKFGEYFSRYGRAFAKNFSGILPDGARVLSLGSGPGHAEKYFQDKGFRVICVDNSTEMIKICEHKGLEGRTMDMEEIDKIFEAEIFDGLWAHTSLLHIRKKNVPRMIGKIAQVLKKGGLFALGLIDGNNEDYDYHPDYPGVKRWFSYFRDEEIVELCKTHFDPVYSRREETKGKRRNYIFLKYILRKK